MNISPDNERKLQCIVEIGLDVTAALRRRHEKGEPQMNQEVVSQNREDVESVVKCVLSLSRSRFPALKTVYLIWPKEYWKHPGVTMVEYVNAGLQKAHSMDANPELVVQLKLSSWERVVATQSRRLEEPQRSSSTSSGTVQSRRGQFGQCPKGSSRRRA